MKILNLLSENFVRNNGITEESRYEIKRVQARDLICSERIDLGAKLIYIRARMHSCGEKFSKEIYRRHLEAFSEGTYHEPGDPGKASMNDYVEVFDELITSFQNVGFDSEKSLIPIDSNGVIMDGGHRLACAIYFDLEVEIIEFPELKKTVCFDYRYFMERKLNHKILGIMANELLSYYHRPVYCMVIWPRADQSKVRQAIKNIEKDNKILLDNSVKLTYDGLRNLMLQIYGNQSWIGSIDDGFSGLTGKVDACFFPNRPCHFVLFEGGELEDVIRMKKIIRGIFGIANHSLHISDCNTETKQMAELLLNPSSVHALNNGKPDKYPDFWGELRERRKRILGENATLAYYGIEYKTPLTSTEMVFDECDPNTFFSFYEEKIPSLSYIADHMKTSKETEKQLKRLANKGANRIFTYYENNSATIYWVVQNGILLLKRAIYATMKKLGLR